VATPVYSKRRVPPADRGRPDGRRAILAAALVILAAWAAGASGTEAPVSADDPARFDEMWDYDDPAATEARFRAMLPALEARGDESLALQLRTQIARSLGLQRRFDASHALLDSVEARLPAAPPVVRVRYLLERGRALNSGGRATDARPLFLEAWDAARACGEDGFAVDAAHMVAIVESGEERVRWNETGLALARDSADPRARRWRGSLLNNLGWTYHDAGDFERAHGLFEEALSVRREEGTRQQVDVARWCVARALRSLGRAEEALAGQQALLADMESAGGPPDGYVYEELGECLLALGRTVECRGWFRKAHELLSKDPWLAAREPERLARMSRLGAGEGVE
jgi:tetratricopeptide (TPR) repeat protein